jgi:hypothetical protein
MEKGEQKVAKGFFSNIQDMLKNDWEVFEEN